MDFSRVEAERNNLNLTKEEFAEKVGATQRTYYNWINGKNPIPSDALIKMAEVCGCTTDYLLGIDRKDEVENKYEGRKEVLRKLKLQFEKVHTISHFFCTRLWQEPVKEIVAQKYPIEKLLE